MGANEVKPYRVIGIKLKQLREAAKETLLEVSGAVEIDEQVLSEIESGYRRPDEDVLMLLLTHFNVSDQETLSLWELAGYSKSIDSDINNDPLKQIMMVIPFDNRTVFSDTAQVDANKSGLTVNFALSLGNSQPQQVAKIGMSLEQAKNLIQQLQAGVVNGSPKTIKMLPAPKSKTDKKKQS